MKICKSIKSLRSTLDRLGGGSLGKPRVFVPTMGALHEGHAALIRRARALAGKDGCVVVSIFVNPAQFGLNEDFSKYPRTFRADVAQCRAAGADVIFAPPPEEIYRPDASVFVDETRLSLPLCGKSRPGHFRGVCTVVAKLFNIVAPDTAVFGEKDWQQLAIIRRMVRDLDFPVKIVGHPIVREKNGLAKSSRNAYLSDSQRIVAAGIHDALREAARREKSPARIVALARTLIETLPWTRIDYIEACDAETLEPLANRRRAGRLLVAVCFAKVRLIDNIALVPIKGTKRT